MQANRAAETQQGQYEQREQLQGTAVMIATQQQHSRDMTSPLLPQRLLLSSSSTDTGTAAPTIASLQDALAYPEQAPHVGPVRRRSLVPHTTTTTSNTNRRHDHKRTAAASAATTKRKKFPPGLARLRDRLQYLEDRLRLDVNTLRQEISDLALRRSLVETRTLATRFDVTGSAAQVVRAYFTMFRYGFQSFPAMDAFDATDSVHMRTVDMLHNQQQYIENEETISPTIAATQTAVLPASLRQLQQQLATATQQQAFLDARVDPQMVFHRFIGRDVLAEQWRRYTQCHAALRLHLRTLVVDGVAAPGSNDVVVRTTGHLTAFVTPATLAQIFPHVARHAALAHQLVGAPIVYPFRIAFHVNAAGAITTYDAELDFVTALNSVLKSLDAVALMLHGAAISDFCLIGDLHGVPQSPRSDRDRGDRASSAGSGDDELMATADTNAHESGCTDAPPPPSSSSSANAAKATIRYLLS